MYAIVAQASVHRLMLHAKSPNLDRTAGSAKLNETNEANFYLFKTLRLLQQKFDDPKETLSNASIFVVAVLAACVVSTINIETTMSIPKLSPFCLRVCSWINLIEITCLSVIYRVLQLMRHNFTRTITGWYAWSDFEEGLIHSLER